MCFIGVLVEAEVPPAERLTSQSKIKTTRMANNLSSELLLLPLNLLIYRPDQFWLHIARKLGSDLLFFFLLFSQRNYTDYSGEYEHNEQQIIHSWNVRKRPGILGNSE